MAVDVDIGLLSLAEQVALAGPEYQREFFSGMSAAELEEFERDWGIQGRPKQQLPEGSWWRTWLILAGRGFGKTRTGVETIKQWVRMGHTNLTLVAPTAEDARVIMVEGESGILQCCLPDERPTYVKNKNELHWPNGAKALVMSADEPDRFRGKQHEKIWGDEVASWRYADAWDQLMFGLRLGTNPQAIVTTTPRPTKLIKEMFAAREDRVDPKTGKRLPASTVVTRGSTFENRGNLAAEFIDIVERKYLGTRLGRQELEAEILGDVEGALWTQARIDAARIGPHNYKPADLERIVVAIDPATTSGEDSDETGIIVCGVTRKTKEKPQRHMLVLDDKTGKYTPEEWAKVACDLYVKWKADRIIGEVNNGGDMIEATVRGHNPDVSYKAVRASRGKVTRAEPVAALYEQGRAHHVGNFPKLEEQMCEFVVDFDAKKAGYSPDHVDALVWGATDLIIDKESTPIKRTFRNIMGR